MPISSSRRWASLPCRRPATTAAQARSSEIDVQLRADRRLLARRINFFVFGEEPDTFIKGLQRLYGGFPAEDLPVWRELIRFYIVRELRHAVSAMLDNPATTSCAPEDLSTWREDLHVLEKASTDYMATENASLDLDSHLIGTLQRCAANAELIHAHLPDPAISFLQDSTRLISPKYTPTPNDIMLLPSRLRPHHSIPNTITCPHISFQTEIPVRFISLPPSRGSRHKYIRMFDNVQGILQIIDLSTYDRSFETHPSDPQTNQSSFLPQLSQLQHTLGSGVFHSHIFSGVVFTNYATFKRKLPSFPLSKLFPGHVDNKDPAVEIDFLMSKVLEDGLLHPYRFVCEEQVPRTKQVVDFFVQRMIDIALRPIGCFGTSCYPDESAPVPVTSGFETCDDDDDGDDVERGLELCRSFSRASTVVG